jgi:hypothetical protein
MSEETRKELEPEIRKEIVNDVKFQHNKQLEKEILEKERFQKNALILQEQVNKLTKPANQGSPEVDGEVQERVLEKYLKKRFPADNIIPVPKGKKGADCIQEIIENNTECGKILWESKDTKSFQENYVSKLLKDMSENNIGFGVLAVDVLPKNCKEEFEFRDNKKIILCKLNKTLDVVSEMARQYAVTVTKVKKYNNKDLVKSQNDLWNLFTSETFIINFRNILKATIKERKQLQKDKITFDKSYKDRKKIMDERKEDLTKIVTQFSSVEGTLLTPELIQIQDDDEEDKD